MIQSIDSLVAVDCHGPLFANFNRLANLSWKWISVPVENFSFVPVYDVVGLGHMVSDGRFVQHLNTIDPTGSIKFTYEEESDRKIPFLDTRIVRKEDGSVKLLVYRKKTHTDQYLIFQSQHPLHQKLRCHQNTYGQNGKYCDRGGG